MLRSAIYNYISDKCLIDALLFLKKHFSRRCGAVGYLYTEQYEHSIMTRCHSLHLLKRRYITPYRVSRDKFFITCLLFKSDARYPPIITMANAQTVPNSTRLRRRRLACPRRFSSTKSTVPNGTLLPRAIRPILSLQDSARL